MSGRFNAPRGRGGRGRGAPDGGARGHDGPPRGRGSGHGRGRGRGRGDAQTAFQVTFGAQQQLAAGPAGPPGGGPPVAPGGPPAAPVGPPGGGGPGPAPVGPVPPTPPPVKGFPALPTRPALTDVVAAWEKWYRCRVSEAWATSVETELKIDVQRVPVTVAGANPHEPLAVMRTMATVYALARLVQYGHREIDIRYHSGRDPAIGALLNKFLCSNGYGSAFAPYITFRFPDGIIVPADINRRPSVGAGVTTATAALYMDVYYSGTGAPVGPAGIIQQYRDVFWVGHIFRGFFGSVGTASWVRDGDLVRWSSDTINDPYPPHPPPDAFLASGSTGTVVWSKSHTWAWNGREAFAAVRITRQFLAPSVLLAQREEQAIMRVMLPDLPKLRRRMPRWLVTLLVHNCAPLMKWVMPKRYVVIDHKHFTAGREYMDTHGRSSWSFNALSQKIGELLARDLEYTQCRTRFPAFFDTYQHDLTLATYLHRIQEDTDDIEMVRAIHGTTLQNYTDSRAHITTPPVVETDWAELVLEGVGFAACAIGLFWVKRRIRRRFYPACVGMRTIAQTFRNPLVSAGFMFVGAPIWEEGFKRIFANRYWRILASAILAVGDLTNMYGADPIDAFFHMFLHYGFSCCSFKKGVILHSLWNAYVLYQREPEWLLTGGLGAQFAQLSLDLSNYRSIAYGAVRDDVDVTRDNDPRYGPMSESSIFQPSSACTRDDEVAIDHRIKLRGNLTDFSLDPEQVGAGEGFYRVMEIPVPMYRPANNGHNMAKVIKYRLRRAVPYTASVEAWQRVAAIYSKMPIIICGTHHVYCLRTLPPGYWHNPTLTWQVTEGVVFEKFDSYELIEVPVSNEPRNLMRVDGIIRSCWRYDQIPPEVDRENYLSWREHTDPAKRARYDAAFETIAVRPLTINSSKVRHVTVNIKTDEVLMKTDFVPRPIHSVDPTVIVTVGPSVYEATQRLKTDWWFKIVAMNHGCWRGDHYVTITYGAGATCDVLDCWYSCALECPGFHIIVAGDDLLVVTQGFQFELDLSQCDHSNKRPQLAFERWIMHNFGVDAFILALIEASQSGVLSCDFRNKDKGAISIERSEERNTGSANTTFGNSVTVGAAACAAAYLFLADNFDAIKKIEQIASEFEAAMRDGMQSLGFDVKTKLRLGNLAELRSGLVPSGTFLKGLWVPCEPMTIQSGREEQHDDFHLKFSIEKNPSREIRFAWTPLLGRCAKFTKTTSDPRPHFRVPTPSGLRRPTLREALRLQFYSVGLSMKPFCLLPEIRDWLLSKEDWVGEVDVRFIKPAFIEPWKVQVGSYPPRVCTAEAYVSFASHYRVRPEDIKSWCSRLCLMRCFQATDDPLWALFVKADYA